MSCNGASSRTTSLFSISEVTPPLVPQRPTSLATPRIHNDLQSPLTTPRGTTTSEGQQGQQGHLTVVRRYIDGIPCSDTTSSFHAANIKRDDGKTLDPVKVSGGIPSSDVQLGCGVGGKLPVNVSGGASDYWGSGGSGVSDKAGSHEGKNEEGKTWFSLRLPEFLNTTININEGGAKWFDAGIRFDPGTCTVVEMLPNCAAHLSSAIQKGDILIALEGESCLSWDYKTIRDKMLGRQGSFVEMTFRRVSPRQEFNDFTLSLMRGLPEFILLVRYVSIIEDKLRQLEGGKVESGDSVWIPPKLQSGASSPKLQSGASSGEGSLSSRPPAAGKVAPDTGAANIGVQPDTGRPPAPNFPEHDARPSATQVVEMNLQLNIDFQTVGQEGSIQRQNFMKDLKQDLADASGMGTSDFNILKVSPGSVVVDVDAPEKAAQEIHRQSLDPNSRLRSGKLTRFTDKISLPTVMQEHREEMNGVVTKASEDLITSSSDIENTQPQIQRKRTAVQRSAAPKAFASRPCQSQEQEQPLKQKISNLPITDFDILLQEQATQTRENDDETPKHTRPSGVPALALQGSQKHEQATRAPACSDSQKTILNVPPDAPSLLVRPQNPKAKMITETNRPPNITDHRTNPTTEPNRPPNPTVATAEPKSPPRSSGDSIMADLLGSPRNPREQPSSPQSFWDISQDQKNFTFGSTIVVPKETACQPVSTLKQIVQVVSRPGPTKDVAKSTHLIQAQMQPSTRQSIPFKSSNTSSSHGYYSQPISKQSLPAFHGQMSPGQMSPSGYLSPMNMSPMNTPRGYSPINTAQRGYSLSTHMNGPPNLAQFIGPGRF